MVRRFLEIFDYLKSKKLLRSLLLAGIMLLSAALMLTLNYKEDIYDFLPFNPQRQKQMSVYQSVSQAERIVVVFECKDTLEQNRELLESAVECFQERANRMDSVGAIFKDLTVSIDYNKVMDAIDFIYSNIPYFLTPSDYAHIDSIVTPQYIKEQIVLDKTMLLFPTGGLLSDNIRRDPLNIFTPTVGRLQETQSNIGFDISNGYIFSSDNRQAYSFFTSPYGASETSRNKELVEMLDQIMQEVEQEIDGVRLHSIGAPVIAVGNASQIKRDSVLAVCISVVLILVLLLYSFHNFRSLMLIVLSIFVGWLFAMGALALIHDEVSMIVLGIASVIIGIAVNYPLHLFAHLNHEPNIRRALKEIISPLVVGNITTVGAFLCLVPLDSVALRDLGLFSSLMLIGTILFVIIFLPHFIKKGRYSGNNAGSFLLRLSNLSLNSKAVYIIVILLTIVLGYFSRFTEFDSNISNINYMTAEQKQDMKQIEGKLSVLTDVVSVYVASESEVFDNAVAASEQAQPLLDSLIASGKAYGKKSATSFMPSEKERESRLAMWKKFISEKGSLLTDSFNRELEENGFNVASFDEFHSIIENRHDSLENSGVNSLIAAVFPTSVSYNGNLYTVVDILDVPLKYKEEVVEHLGSKLPHSYVFDMHSLNSQFATSLSDNFNYIVWSCGFIVFFFLWLSFGRIELSIMAFAPMAISWIWILGLMYIFDIQFNIVNIILATFIFGQGDDYTIFMTEGLIYEYAYKKRMLASYKNSIILSALIMFVGIGSLIVAKHPALFSLAEVTIVGMFSVVLMAYIVPPFIFRWFTSRKGRERRVPVTLERLTVMLFMFVVITLQFAAGAVMYLVFVAILRKPAFMLGYRYLMARVCCKLLWGVKVVVHNGSNRPNGYGTDNMHYGLWGKKYKVIYNSDSYLSRLLIYSLSPKIADIHPLGKDICPEYGKEAFSPDTDSSVKNIAVYIHGADYVMPHGELLTMKGRIDIYILEACEEQNSGEVLELFSRQKVVAEKEVECADYFIPMVKNKYLYKGHDVERSVKEELHRNGNYTTLVDSFAKSCNYAQISNIVVLNSGYGVVALLFALVYKQKHVYAFEPDADKFNIANNLAYLPDNLTFINGGAKDAEHIDNSVVYNKKRENYGKEN